MNSCPPTASTGHKPLPPDAPAADVRVVKAELKQVREVTATERRRPEDLLAAWAGAVTGAFPLPDGPLHQGVESPHLLRHVRYAARADAGFQRAELGNCFSRTATAPSLCRDRSCGAGGHSDLLTTCGLRRGDAIRAGER
jgi:hypothetical protein